MNPKGGQSRRDPKRSISFLHSRRSAKPNFCAMEIYEAVVGGLNLPARSRLVGALLLEQNDEWALQRRYMTLETLSEVGDNPTIRLSAVTV